MLPVTFSCLLNKNDEYKKLNLIPLYQKSEKLPIIARLCGYYIVNELNFTNEKDKEEYINDVKYLGFTENHIYDIKFVIYIKNLCKNISVGDIYLFQGGLGAGKTTFVRLLINNLFVLNNLPKPSSITSPTFPILITYELNSSQIYHYDLYRVKSLKELEELDFFENLNNNITFIEWPEMLISLPLNKNHYLINLDMISETKRKINMCFKQ